MSEHRHSAFSEAISRDGGINVYCLLRYEPYEGADILSVHSTEEGAKRARLARISQIMRGPGSEKYKAKEIEKLEIEDWGLDPPIENEKELSEDLDPLTGSVDVSEAYGLYDHHIPL